MDILIDVINGFRDMPAGSLIAIVSLGAMFFAYMVIRAILQHISQQGGQGQ